MRNTVVMILLILLSCGTLFAEPRNPSPVIAPVPVPIKSTETQGTTNVNPTATPFGTNLVRIVEPAENAKLPAISATFVCGSAPPAGKLLINGIPVPIHPGGGFVAMVNLVPGKFEIVAELQLGDTRSRVTRTISVAEPTKPAPVSPLTIEYVTPRQDQELLPGDLVEVVCKGSPGCQGTFSIKGVRKKFPMIESERGVPGIYRGIYQLGLKDKLNQSKIKVTLVNSKHQQIVKEAEGTLSLFPNDLPQIAEITSPDCILRAGSAMVAYEKAGYMMFPPLGTFLQIIGKRGDEYRVRLNKTNTVWVSRDQVKLLPEGTLPARVVIGSISVSADAQSTKIRIPIGAKIPFKIDPNPEGNQIEVSLFGAFSNTDWINYSKTDIVKSLSWFQDDEETYRLKVTTVPNSWWGYDTRYEGNILVLELRNPPSFSAGSSPLTGLTIALDPGHFPDTGAIGTTGYAEKDANLAQALNLKEKLLAKGAKVVMIRQNEGVVPLIERPKKAWQNKADILISLHNNSLGYGGNPLVKHGFGVYYFTPMSLPLAKAIHAAYGDTFKAGSEFSLRDDGLYYGNLALTRAPQMPSILVESAYMIVPEEEALLKNEGFRSACSNAIITGLENYARSMRPEIPKGK